MGVHDHLTIVLATDSVAPSGVGEHMLTLAAALRADHRVVLAFPAVGSGASFLTRAQDAGCEIVPIADEPASFTTDLRHLSPAVLHVHAGVGWEGHGLAEAGRNAGIPVVRTEHLPYVLTDEQQRHEHRTALALVERTIFVSEATHETYRQHAASGPRAVTIRNGVSRPKPAHDRSETRRALDIPDSDAVVTTIARFTPQKGYEFLLAAARDVLAQSEHVHFLLIGDGPERPAMQALADSLGIAGFVRFLGSRHDVPDLLAASDIFVLPSLFEGLPLVVLEAMALDLPVVATRIGGTSEALGADYPWLVEPGASAILAETILAALRDGALSRELGGRNRRRYEQQFMAERMAAETAALYRDIVAEGM